MLARLGDRLSALFRATAPDPFVLAVLLTALTFALALLFTDATPRGLVAAWADPKTGVWKLLEFAMQMCLILVTGHAVAASRPVAAALRRLADLPRSGAQAAAMVALVAMGLAVLNWGLGLIAGAIVARDTGRSLARRGVPHHYPVLVAAGYLGLMVWHGGFSGTAPLMVSRESGIASVLPAGTELAPIPLSATILSPLNLVVTGGLIAIGTMAMALMMPRENGQRCRVPEGQIQTKPDAETEEPNSAFVRTLEETPIVNLALAALIAAWAIPYYLPGRGSPSGILSLTPNEVNLTMLMLALVLHGSPRSLLAAVEEGARGCAGIILQFPLYAGIMAMMHASGLTAELSRLVSRGAGETTLAPMTFLSAGLVNLFVPSGGGQWAVQGPIVVESALATGAGLPEAVMALAYGDQLTNMLQPFWALPLLAITGAKAREIVGYTAIAMALGILWTLGCLWAM